MIGVGIDLASLAVRGGGSVSINDVIEVGAGDGDTPLPNVLDNDPGAATISAVDGDGGNVGSPVAGSSGGLFTIASNGDTSFDPDGDFSLVPLGAVVTSTVEYTNDLGQTGVVTARITGTLEIEMMLLPEDWGSLEEEGDPTGALAAGTEVTLAAGFAAETVGAVSRTGGGRGTACLTCGAGGTIRYTYGLPSPVANFAAAVRLAPDDLTAISMTATAGGITVALSGGTATVTLTDGSGTWSASRPYNEAADTVVIGFRVQSGVLGVLVDGDDAADEATDDLTGYSPGIAETLDIGSPGAVIYGGTVQSSASLSAADIAAIIAEIAQDRSTLVSRVAFGWSPITQGSGSSLTDYSGNGADGTITGTPTLDGSGLHLTSASGQRVTSTALAGIAADGCAIFVRLKATDVDSTIPQWLFGVSGATAGSCPIWLSISNFLGGLWSGQVVGSGATDNTFYDLVMLVLPIDASNVRLELYKNGTFSGARATTALVAADVDTFCVGLNSPSSNPTLSLGGTVEHAVGWSRLLSAAEIAELSSNRTAWMLL